MQPEKYTAEAQGLLVVVRHFLLQFCKVSSKALMVLPGRQNFLQTKRSFKSLLAKMVVEKKGLGVSCFKMVLAEQELLPGYCEAWRASFRPDQLQVPSSFLTLLTKSPVNSCILPLLMYPAATAKR